MTNIKNIYKGIEANVKSIQRDFQTEHTEIVKPKSKNNSNPVDISKVPKEQKDKLESYIQQWENPSKWYECRIKGIEWFLEVADKNDVTPENVEFVIEKTSNNQPLLKPVVKGREVKEKTIPKMDDMDRLRKFLKQCPEYRNRVENGENVADMAISIIKNYLDKEEKRRLGLDV